MKPVRKPLSMTRNAMSSLEIFRRVELTGACVCGTPRYKATGEGGPYRSPPGAKAEQNKRSKWDFEVTDKNGKVHSFYGEKMFIWQWLKEPPDKTGFVQERLAVYKCEGEEGEAYLYMCFPKPCTVKEY